MQPAQLLLRASQLLARMTRESILARVHRQEGQTMPEYAILIGVIALIVVVVAITLGSHISGIFSSTAQRL
jgi:Flp pilus assembly pilin Flp